MKKIQDLVSYILLDKPDTRCDDKKLYYEACIITNPKVAKMSFDEVVAEMVAFRLPSYDSVSRARRKLQAELPLIYGSDEFTREVRAKKEKEFREYAKKKV